MITFQHDNRLSYGIVGAQTKGQFHLIYGAVGTQALFTGLATQIGYGGCDHDTVDFYSKASGTRLPTPILTRTKRIFVSAPCSRSMRS